MKACLRSLVLMTFWLGISSAFAPKIIENNRWNSFTPSEYCSCHPISTIYSADLAISSAQKISQGLNRLAEANLGALKPISLTSVDALPLPSINANQPSFILQKALTVYVTAESIPEPALLLMLGMSLLGVSRLILSRKLKGKGSAMKHSDTREGLGSAATTTAP
jgi:hypothetical protein